jgi:hypothetical protein
VSQLVFANKAIIPPYHRYVNKNRRYGDFYQTRLQKAGLHVALAAETPIVYDAH